jgi:hypothetical protein
MDADVEDEVEFRVLNFGWRDRLPKLPRPVAAFGDNDLWLVRAHGTGISVLSLHGGNPLLGFCTTVIVAALNRHDAAARGLERIRIRWRSSAPGRRDRGSLKLEVDAVEQLEGRFRWESGRGYTFYSTEE